MATAVVLGQPLSKVSKSTLARWLSETGIDPVAATWVTVIPEYGGDHKEGVIKQNVARVLAELAAIPGLDMVIAVGRFAVRLDGDLWRGGIGKSHGHSGKLKLTEDKGVNAIAMMDPYNYVRNVKDGNTRRAIEIESSCKLILSRVRTMDAPLFLPEVHTRPRVAVNGLVGLDCETTDDKELHKLISRGPVEARSSKLKMVGLSDGQLSFEGADFGPDAEPIAWNLPFDAIVTKNWSARWHDPKMLYHLMGEKDLEMKSSALRELGRPMMHYDEAANTDREPAYCVADATTHRDLLDAGLKRASPGIRSLYENIERPMFRLYNRWSMEGVFALDKAGAQELYDRQLDEIETLSHAIQKLTRGRVANPDSTDDVAAYVFGWDPATDPQKVNKPSVDISALTEKMNVRGVPEILERRGKKKQSATYLGAWLKWPWERLGCLWRPTGAWTGRPSVAALQLHNVPPSLRKFLGPAAGKVLWSFDNSQLEIRIAAHISRDSNMIRLLRGEMPGYEDGDIHRWATDILGAHNRTFGKIANFSTLYGGSEAAIYSQAPKFGISVDEIRPLAKKINKTLPAMFPEFFQWKHKVENLPRVPGLFGATLVPPPHGDESYMQREKVNAPIQRGAVDTVKVQTLAVELAGFHSVHQIHDEIIIELDERDANEDTLREIKRIMSEAVRLDVPLKVDQKVWGSKG